MMQIWSEQDFRTMPWKNGGGSTTELAIYPPDAGLDQFIWRLSTATVATDGPFSHFAGIERSLAVLSGDGMDLYLHDTGDEGEVAELRIDSAPFRFSGETPVVAKLLNGVAVTDLNMMSRREVCSHTMLRFGEGDHFVQAGEAQQILLYCHRGQVSLTDGTLVRSQQLLLQEENHAHEGISLQFTATAESDICLIIIRFSATGAS
ncbi:HutD family protein [Undibacterium luofuense]|uniref:HutD/Ves family protein n=1 Tax=Undibacterium luofuense TaxID=2828733 RepID=UPI0030ECA92C